MCDASNAYGTKICRTFHIKLLKYLAAYLMVYLNETKK